MGLGALVLCHWLKFPQSEQLIGCTVDWKPGFGEVHGNGHGVTDSLNEDISAF